MPVNCAALKVDRDSQVQKLIRAATVAILRRYIGPDEWACLKCGHIDEAGRFAAPKGAITRMGHWYVEPDKHYCPECRAMLEWHGWIDSDGEVHNEGR